MPRQCPSNDQGKRSPSCLPLVIGGHWRGVRHSESIRPSTHGAAMRSLLSLIALVLLASPSYAAEKIPVLIDTDIGSFPDDVFALALTVASPAQDLLGVTTVGGGADDRAWLACRYLTQVGVKNIPVAIGAATPEKT